MKRTAIFENERSFTPTLTLPHQGGGVIRGGIEGGGNSVLLFLPFLLCLLLFNPSISFAAEGDLLTKFHPYISVQEEYSDNLYQTPTNKKDDFITTVSPGLKFSTMDKTTETSGIDLDYKMNAVFYSKENDNNFIGHQGDLTAKYLTSSHFNFYLRESFTRSEDPRERQYYTTTDQNQYVLSTQQQRAIYWRNVVSPTMEYQFGKEDRIGVNYRNNIFRTQAIGREDSQEDYINPYLTFWFNQYNGVHLEYGHTWAKFDVSPDYVANMGIFRYTVRFNPKVSTYLEYDFHRNDYEPPKTDYDVHEGYVGLEYTFSKVWSSFLQVGYFKQNPETGTGKDGFSYKGGMVLRDQQTTFNLNLQGGYNEDYFTSENLGFHRYNRLSLYVNQMLGQHFSVGVNGSVERADYDPDRRDWIYSAGGNLSFQPWKWLTFSLEYTYRENNSDIDVNDYKENRGILRITATY